MIPNQPRDRLFLMLDERFKQMLQGKHRGQAKAFHDSIPEWDERLRLWGIEVAESEDETLAYRYFRESFSGLTFRPQDPQLVSDPCYELGLRLGLLKEKHRWLRLDDELATKILALGLP